MKVKKIIKNTLGFEITGATLLTIEEARKLPEILRKYDERWWLCSSGYNDSRATAVLDDGLVYSCSIFVDTFYIAVRPALIISNLESSGLKIGDTFEFGDKEFEIVSSDKAFCLSDIGTSAFRNDWEAPDANDYEKSDVKKFIDKWFEKEIGKC